MIYIALTSILFNLAEAITNQPAKVEKEIPVAEAVISSDEAKAEDSPAEDLEHKRYMEKAALLYSEQKYEQAEEAYTLLIKRNHRDIDALIGRGNCRLRLRDRTDGALDDFGKVIILTPSYMDAHIGAATCLKRKKDEEGAQKALENALALCNEDQKKIQYLADTAWQLGHWEFARKLDHKYNDIPTEQEIQQAKAKEELAVARSKNPPEAEEAFNSMIEKDPRNVDALVGRGNARLRIDGKTKDALADFEKVIVLSPSYMDAYIGIATCHRRLKNPEGCEKALNQAYALCNGDQKKIQYLADTSWQYGHSDFARKLDPGYNSKLSESEKLRAEHVATLEKARDLRLDGHVEEAEDIYKELLKTHPDDVDVITGIAFCKLRDEKRLDEALEDFHKVITLSPLYIDAYIGAAICYKRQDKREELEDILEQCRTACKDNPSKSRYLATTAWREGYYPLAREIDDEYEPEDDRKLTSEPHTLRATYGHSWLEAGDDWDELRLTASSRIRPDITLSGEYDNWWRYGGEYDFNLGLGASYRHDYRWSGDYWYEFSDIGGYLAEQRHNADLKYRLYRRLHIEAGPRFAKYSGDWSEKLRIGMETGWKKLLAQASYTFGNDTKNENVSSYSVSAGYYEELRYSLAAGFSQGEETVDFLRNDEVIFRSDDVDSIFARGTYYFTDTFGCSAGWMQEYRNSDLFRRELTLSLFKSF